jgi:hypothetical protein
MPYHLDLQTLPIEYLKERLMAEDLIPSMTVLREGLGQNLARLKRAGLKTLQEAEKALKTKKNIEILAESTGIPGEYLTVLGRALRGYRPKPHSLAEFPELGAILVKRLSKAGADTTLDLYQAAASRKGREGLCTKAGVDEKDLIVALRLSDLSRIQWVSPVFARLILAAGYGEARAVAKASPESLYRDVAAANDRLGLFKGKIGLRDMGRLVFLARELEFEVEF